MNNYSLDQINLILENYKYILCDKKVFSLYSRELKSLSDKFTYFLENPEQNKTFSTFEKVSNFFLDHNITRQDTILIIGGGAVSDLGGYIASSLLRGIKWACIPTTILSHIDASIGGKTGINTKHGKNQIGSFHNPTTLYTCTDFFKSLSVEEKESGLGELMKYALLDQSVFDSIISGDLERAFVLSKDYKCAIVLKDPLEQSCRKILNLGHTFGHCFESILKLTHGKCVRMGLELICQLYAKEHVIRLRELEKALLLKEVDFFKVDKDRFLNLLRNDKKIVDNTIELIIPEGFSSVIEARKMSDVIIDLERYNENFQIFI